MSGLGTAKSNSHRKTHQVEPDGPGRKYMFLLGEILAERAAKKSAEAIVLMTLAERQEERRAEESRKNHSPDLLGLGMKVSKARRRSNCGHYRLGELRGQVEAA